MKLFRHKKPLFEFDEILLDASNLPSFDTRRAEGRIETPIRNRSIIVIGVLFTLIAITFSWRTFSLQVLAGDDYRERSEQNKLSEALIIAERGVVYDRNGELLAWNEVDSTGEYEFPVRAYTDRRGLGQLIGFVSYPKKDTSGFYFRTEYLGRSGVEESFNETLAGVNGSQLVEVNALGEVISSSVIDLPKSGEEITLSIDGELSEAMHDIIATSSVKAGFRGGAGAIMDVTTGEILAMTSYPSFDPEVMADGDDIELINKYTSDERLPFLNKVVGGVYTPGSVVKPFLVYAALLEGIITPNTSIVSTGEIVIPNPYTPSQPSIFTDWRAHGRMDARESLAFSSNVYMYYISGGYGSQRGLGINKMNEYYDLFKFGQSTDIALLGEQSGTVPSPAWKEETFDEDWRLGDTYNTSIGQFGWQTTPIQMLRAYTAIANGGTFFKPHLGKGIMGESETVELDPATLRVIHEAMHMTTNYPGGTARGLEKKYVKVAAKSGTAEVGAGNRFVNSWAAGFWPYEEPKYAFVLMMEHAPRSNTLGATTIMGQVVDWIHENRPEYLGIESEDTLE